ncbi:MAG: Ig-like domain-containing protein [Arhodomonas sp.]|nr:Ig-like domain-containing protein [Arhodomonas sp.]
MFVATEVDRVDVRAEPTQIQPGGRSAITAVVRDPASNRVQGAEVAFNISKDNTGGWLSSTSDTTNSSGVATTTYEGGETSSAKGVLIRDCRDRHRAAGPSRRTARPRTPSA